jgi:hypothetical protein
MWPSRALFFVLIIEIDMNRKDWNEKTLQGEEIENNCGIINDEGGGEKKEGMDFCFLC